MSKCPQVEIAELKEKVELCEIIAKRALRDNLRLRSEIDRLTAERDALLKGMQRVAEHYYMDKSDSFVRRRMFLIAVEEIQKHEAVK